MLLKKIFLSQQSANEKTLKEENFYLNSIVKELNSILRHLAFPAHWRDKDRIVTF